MGPRLALALALSLWCAATGPAAVITATWLGGAGDWTDPTHWDSNPLYPNNNAVEWNAIVPSGSVWVLPPPSVISVTGLSLRTPATLELLPGSNLGIRNPVIEGSVYVFDAQLRVTGPSIVNSGPLTLDGPGAVLKWEPPAGLAIPNLTGGGTITATNGAAIRFTTGGAPIQRIELDDMTYEDSWPSRLDSDFNDTVMGYSFAYRSTGGTATFGGNLLNLGSVRGVGNIFRVNGNLDSSGNLNLNGSDLQIGQDMNMNGVPDECDISGSSVRIGGDLNVNGIPDECEINGSTVEVGGSLNNTAGGSLRFTDSQVQVGGDLNNGGVFEANNSAVNIFGQLRIDASGIFSVGVGAEAHAGGIVYSDGKLRFGGSIGAAVGVGGTLRSDVEIDIGQLGSLEGQGTLAAPRVTNSGQVKPGVWASAIGIDPRYFAPLGTSSLSQHAAVGTLTIEGDYFQTDVGVLEIELGDLEFDQLVITGTAYLDGTVTIRLLPTANIPAGMVFDFLSADAVIGTFAVEDVPLDGEGQPLFAISYGPSGVSATALQDIQGAAIPEPCTLALLALGLLALRRRARRRA
ncbi:MAG: PEP-CTERM sorting domain-containing protein [Planctomycetes bacterium]|nr:PEP-CTERM sorting domain-containing protein [Planctomycetota bacterium]